MQSTFSNSIRETQQSIVRSKTISRLPIWFPNYMKNKRSLIKQLITVIILYQTSRKYWQIDGSIKLPEFINYWLSFQLVCETTEESSANKTMYSEGEELYLKDLDCVTIVKAIRELKAMSRVILTQQQRQLLAFERESVLPTNKELEGLEAESIHNKVPFETMNNMERSEYLAHIDKFMHELECTELTKTDANIINEISMGAANICYLPKKNHVIASKIKVVRKNFGRR